jgi:hypothetical protein
VVSALPVEERAELWQRHFGVFDDVVYGALEGEWCARCAARERRRVARVRRWLRGRRPTWWPRARHDFWCAVRRYGGARLLDRMEARERERSICESEARKADPSKLTLDDLRGLRHVLSHARFVPVTREAFEASDPLSPLYVGRPEVSLLRDRRERGNEWA